MSRACRFSGLWLVVIFLASPAVAGDWCEGLLAREFRAQRAGQPLMERAVLQLLSKPIRNKILKGCARTPEGCSEAMLARAVREAIEDVGGRARMLRGYGALVGMMVASAAATSHLTESLPKSAKFLAFFVAQVSTVGVYVLGAPIWEPVSSAFRRWAFGLSAKDDPASQASRPELEALWGRTQSTYSNNAQMSRNVLSQFLTGFRLNLEAARKALQNDTPFSRADAVDELAEAAIRLRRLYGDLDPADPSVALAVRASFVAPLDRRGVALSGLSEETLQRVLELDPEAARTDIGRYYERLLKAWLN